MALPSYKPPVNYRSAPSHTPSPEPFVISGAKAIIQEAPADPTDVATPVAVIVNGTSRTRTTNPPAVGQYRIGTASVIAADGTTHTEYFPVLEFNAADEGLSGTIDYYRTGTVHTAEWYAFQKDFLTPLIASSEAALTAAFPPTGDVNLRGRPGDQAMLTDGTVRYSDGTQWRFVPIAFGVSSFPSPSASYHKQIYVKVGGSGQEDEVGICLKGWDNNYYWRTFQTGGP